MPQSTIAAQAWHKQPSSWAWSSLIRTFCLKLISCPSPACLMTHLTASAAMPPALCSMMAPVLPSLAPTISSQASNQQHGPVMLPDPCSKCKVWASTEQILLGMHQAHYHRQHRELQLHMRDLSFPQAATASQVMSLRAQPRSTAQCKGKGTAWALQGLPCHPGVTASFGRWPPARRHNSKHSSMGQH